MAVAGLAGHSHRQGMPFRIAVVGENAGCRHIQHRVLRRGISIVVRHRRQVDLVNGQKHGGFIAFNQAIVGPVGEAVRAKIAGVGHVSEAAVGVR